MVLPYETFLDQKGLSEESPLFGVPYLIRMVQLVLLGVRVIEDIKKAGTCWGNVL